MICQNCGKEFGLGTNCQHCGIDKVEAGAEFVGYNNPSASQHQQYVKGQPASNNVSVCPFCSEIIPENSKFCPSCGQPLTNICPVCGTKFSARYPICPECGNNFKESSAKVAAISEAIDRQRQEQVEQYESRLRKFLEEWNMVLVEGGRFQMGATPEQGASGISDRKPVHDVEVDTFIIDQTPVTQGFWVRVMGYNPSKVVGEDYPVTNISIAEAWQFINQLREQTGIPFRLPTEAEWEYAARGGNRSCGYKYSGSNYLDEVGWYKDNSGKCIHPVGMKKPNELNLYDMSGNVEEFVHDVYDANFYSHSPLRNPVNTSQRSGLKAWVVGVKSYVTRGGSYCQPEKYLTSSYRFFAEVADKTDFIGLRLAVDLPDFE